MALDFFKNKNYTLSVLMKRKLCSAKEFHKPKVGTTKKSLVLVIFLFFIIFFHYAIKGYISRSNSS